MGRNASTAHIAVKLNYQIDIHRNGTLERINSYQSRLVSESVRLAPASRFLTPREESSRPRRFMASTGGSGVWFRWPTRPQSSCSM
jgi:hypothetical protein